MSLRPKAMVSLCVAVFILSSCSIGDSPKGTDPRPVSGGKIVVGLAEVGTLDPAGVTGDDGLTVLRAACDGVIGLDRRSGRLEPALAKSWSFRQGAQKLLIQLREGIVFRDGTRVNPQSVRESLSRVARPDSSSPWAGLVDKVQGFAEVQSGEATHLSGVRAMSASSLEIELAEPFSDFPKVLTHPALTPVSLRSLAASSGVPQTPVCAGPYEIRQEEPGQFRLVRQTAAGSTKRTEPGKRATRMADEILVRNFDTPQDAYAAFKSGKVDIAPVPETEIADAQERRGFERQPGAETAVLAFDATKPPMSDPRFRRAVSLALDRLVIIDAAFSDGRAPALRWLPEGFRKEPGSACEEFIRRVADPERAKEHLADAGGGGERPIPLFFDVTRFGRLVAQAVQIQVRDALGVVLDPRPLDSAAFEGSLKNRPEPGVWLTGTGVELPIANELVGELFGTASAKNRTGFSDPDVDAAIKNARMATDERDAARLWVEAENLICEKMPAIPMWRAAGQWIRDPGKVVLTGDSMLDQSGSPDLRFLRGAAD